MTRAEGLGKTMSWQRSSIRSRQTKGSQCCLGTYYDTGRGVGQDHVMAAEWYRKSADQGDADAQNNLAACYKKGQGVEKS
jgi:hypothetical protein